MAVLGFSATSVWPQPAPVPAEFQSTYNQLQGKLQAFDTTIMRQWNGQTSSTSFSASLSVANGNRGAALLQTAARQGVPVEIARMQQLGMKGVVVSIPFPILAPGFFQWLGRPADLQGYLEFYRFVAAEVRSRGMKLTIESGPMFPGVFSSGAGFDVARYYPTLTDQQYIDGRAETLTAIARELRPDYLQFGAEPDTEASLVAKPALGTTSGYSSLIRSTISKITAAGIRGVEFGSGVGTWMPSITASAFIEAAVAAGVDFIDLHVYPVNRDFLDNTIAYADLARTRGKKILINEAWLLKTSETEIATVDPGSDPRVFSRDAFSFWAPLDQLFLTTLVKFSHWKRVDVLSAFWSRYFYAYVDYNQVKDLPPDQIIAQSTQAASSALVNGTFTETGRHYQRLIAPPAIGVVSAASFAGARVALDSIISIFGANLAPRIELAPPGPLPVSLAGTSMVITDRTGARAPCTLYFVSAGQINAVVPANLLSGAATLTVTPAQGSPLTTQVELAAVEPGIFTANADGKGVPAAIVSRLAADGRVTFDTAFECGSTAGSCVPKPIDFGPETDQVFLSLFGTGVRNRSALSAVRVAAG